MKILFLIFLSLFSCSLDTKAQEIEVFEYTYNYTTINNGDTSKDDYSILISKSKIIQYKGNFNGENYSLIDFNLGKSVIVGNGRKSSLFNINENRKYKLESNENKCKSLATLIQFNDTSYANEYLNFNTYFKDSVYIDSTQKIPHFKPGGFASWLDNGSGFLPIKFIREITSDKDYSIKKIIFTFISKKTSKITREYFEF